MTIDDEKDCRDEMRDDDRSRGDTCQDESDSDEGERTVSQQSQPLMTSNDLTLFSTHWLSIWITHGCRHAVLGQD